MLQNVHKTTTCGGVISTWERGWQMLFKLFKMKTPFLDHVFEDHRSYTEWQSIFVEKKG